MVKCMLIGVPGSGKGTQAEKIAEFLDIPVVTMSALLKKQLSADSDLGREVAAKMREGILISDDIIWKILSQELAHKQYAKGYILDGFPRTMAQADMVEAQGFLIDLVLHLAVEDAVIVRRMEGRRVHPASGRVYHIEFAPPLKPGLDDKTGEALIQREDDRAEVVKKRLTVFHNQTEPVIEWVKSHAERKDLSCIRHYYKIDAAQNPQKVWADIQEILKEF